jgi:hypothetical protein
VGAGTNADTSGNENVPIASTAEAESGRAREPRKVFD